MPSEERNTWASLAVSLMVNLYFLRRILAMFSDGTSTAPDAMQLWARTVIWVVPISIVAHVTLIVVASVVHTALSGEKQAVFLKDERDFKFELLGMGAMMLLVVLGFLAALSTLALGYSGFIAFNLIYAGFALGDIANNFVRLGLYRSGT